MNLQCLFLFLLKKDTLKMAKADSDYTYSETSSSVSTDSHCKSTPNRCFSCKKAYFHGDVGWEYVDWAGYLYCPECIVQQCERCGSESNKGDGRKPPGWRYIEARSCREFESWVCPECQTPRKRDRSNDDDYESADSDESSDSESEDSN